MFLRCILKKSLYFRQDKKTFPWRFVLISSHFTYRCLRIGITGRFFTVRSVMALISQFGLLYFILFTAFCLFLACFSQLGLERFLSLLWMTRDSSASVCITWCFCAQLVFLCHSSPTATPPSVFASSVQSSCFALRWLLEYYSYLR